MKIPASNERRAHFQARQFINAIFQKHDEFIERLLKQPNGKQKIIELYDIKNLEGYPSLK